LKGCIGVTKVPLACVIRDDPLACDIGDDPIVFSDSIVGRITMKKELSAKFEVGGASLSLSLSLSNWICAKE